MTTLDELFGARLATIVPDLVSATRAAELRDRFERAGYTRFRGFDRGSYDELRELDEPELCADLTALAAKLTGRALVLGEARVLRFLPGDYLLSHHDRIHTDQPVEVVLELSPASVPGAEVHYRRRGQVYFRAPCVPGAMAVVERGPTVTCNHTYVSKLHADASVVRFVVLLRNA